MTGVRLTPVPAWIAVLVLAMLSLPAPASQRVALVVGNASYAHAPALANPLNDAADIGAVLGRLGFSVTRLENAGYAALRRGLQEFARAASASEIAVVYYAGHGIEVDRRNFLVPVDARLASDQDVEFEAVPLELVSRAVERASGLRLVILDACRENPFAVRMQRAGATRSIGRGLARVEPPGETLVAYAAKEGTVASDGAGPNSPYSEALLTHLEEPGLEVGLLFRKVRDAVLASTGGRQEPFVYGSLSSRGVYLAPSSPMEPGGDAATAGDGVAGSESAAEVQFWKSIENIRDPSAQADALVAYKTQYPRGVYVALADIRLKMLQAPDTASQSLPSSAADEAGLDLTRDDRRRIQRALSVRGFDPGPMDGLFGRGTRAAIRDWQAAGKLPATGHLDADAVKLLLATEAGSDPAGRENAGESSPTPVADPSAIFLASGLSLSDWVLLAEDRLASGDYRSLLVEGAGHTRKYGTFDGVASIVDRAIDGLTEGLRVNDEASARSALQSVERIRDVSGPRQSLHRIVAMAYSRLGRFEEAVEAYRSWLRMAPSDHPERKEMVIALQRAQRGERPLAALDTFRDCAQCPSLVVVPDGMYRMGSPSWEKDREDGEGPMHDVIMGRPVAVGMYEVTFTEWDACRREGSCSHDPPDQGWGRANRPVINVSWEDAQEYVRWLSRKTGKRYRLPSESEWEYAARGGTTTRYHWGDEIERNGANCAGCGSRWDGASTSPAGSFSPNPFGLYDMHGNVWEWVEDCWHDDYEGAPSNGGVWTDKGDCSRRVLRGGSFFTSPTLLRSAYRSQDPSRSRLKLVGFRVARELD